MEHEVGSFSTRERLAVIFEKNNEIPKAKFIPGPLFDKIVKILRSVEAQLRTVSQDLPVGLTKAVMTIDERTMYEALSEPEREAVDAVRETRKQSIDTFIKDEVTPLTLHQDQVVEFSSPKNYHQQEFKRSCVAANFRMIFESITGQLISEGDIMELGRKFGFLKEEEIPGEVFDKETLFSIFRSKKFKELFSRNTNTLDIMGTDFNFLRKIVDKLKDQFDVYCIVSIKSEVAEDGWHSVILLQADDTEVTIHDPSQVVGSAARKLSKDEFMKRWGETYLEANLILVEKNT